MQTFKIFMSNLGYARGINGGLVHHTRYMHRHFYCTPLAQEQTLSQVRALLEKEDPDVCCFVEIDKGSATSANFNQLEALITHKYVFSDIENKYGQMSWLRGLAFTRGKSNAFMSKRRFAFEKLYLRSGAKRLLYKIHLASNLTLFFVHFSLKQSVRSDQLAQVAKIIQDTAGEVILLGDFNILTGMKELKPLLRETSMILLNEEDRPTFFFHKRHLTLDLCLCSPSLASHAALRIVPQPYSDHAALILEVQIDPARFHV
jgi:endonuclease/exonuclease/phosphatase family metal-dependent hydrolase